MKLKVVVAHDLLLLRDAIVSLLAGYDSMEISGESSFDQKLINICRADKPDILLAYAPPDVDKIFPLITDIKNCCRNLKVLLITEIKEEGLYLKYFAVGVNGVVDPNSSRAILISAVKTIFYEKNFIKVYDNKIEKFDYQENIDLLFTRRTQHKVRLTPREKEILLLISEGLTTKQISDKLMLSKRTVDYFRCALIQKLHVDSTAGLIRRAIILTSGLS